MDSLQIREASDRDTEFIVMMIETAAKEGKFHSDTPSEEDFRKHAFENPPKNYLLLVALEKDEIVGYADSRVRRGVGLVLGLYVKPKFRNKGIGTALIQRTMLHFAETGCHKSRLEVFMNNCGAIDFYRREGFESEGFLRMDEEKKDTVIMSKFL